MIAKAPDQIHKSESSTSSDPASSTSISSRCLLLFRDMADTADRSVTGPTMPPPVTVDDSEPATRQGYALLLASCRITHTVPVSLSSLQPYFSLCVSHIHLIPREDGSQILISAIAHGHRSIVYGPEGAQIIQATAEPNAQGEHTPSMYVPFKLSHYPRLNLTDIIAQRHGCTSKGAGRTPA